MVQKMRFVIQRVTSAKVTIEERVAGQIADNPLPVQYDTYYDNDHSKFERY